MRAEKINIGLVTKTLVGAYVYFFIGWIRPNWSYLIANFVK